VPRLLVMTIRIAWGLLAAADTSFGHPARENAAGLTSGALKKSRT
jgi:hypothetical protein